MSIGRNHPSTAKGVRDPEADYTDALIAEYESYVGATGLDDKVAEIAAALKERGHDVKRPAAGTKETAVSEPKLETAVETENPKGEKPEEPAEEPEAPRRRGRPRKDAD